MKTFTSITESQPLSYAFNRPKFYRNKAREERWGEPVYFVPSSNGYDVLGTAGPYYVYGKPCKQGQGKKGNCTWWVLGRLAETTNEEHKELIGDAQYFYDKYKGRKDNVGYIGDKVQKGDVLVYSDGDVGHVNFIEDDLDEDVVISESAYSSNAVYENKACIVYTLKKEDLMCGKSIKLRPQSPYYETLKGVIHTGDVFDKEKEETKLEKINKLAKEIVNLSK